MNQMRLKECDFYVDDISGMQMEEVIQIILGFANQQLDLMLEDEKREITLRAKKQCQDYYGIDFNKYMRKRLLDKIKDFNIYFTSRYVLLLDSAPGIQIYDIRYNDKWFRITFDLKLKIITSFLLVKKKWFNTDKHFRKEMWLLMYKCLGSLERREKRDMGSGQMVDPSTFDLNLKFCEEK
jgi:hypothetical protein